MNLELTPPEGGSAKIKPNEKLTNIQEIQTYLELVYKHPRNVSKRFQKDISSRTKDIKQFSQLITHGRTDARTSVNLELAPPEVGQLINTSHAFCT